MGIIQIFKDGTAKIKKGLEESDKLQKSAKKEGLTFLPPESVLSSVINKYQNSIPAGNFLNQVFGRDEMARAGEEALRKGVPLTDEQRTALKKESDSEMANAGMMIGGVKNLGTLKLDPEMYRPLTRIAIKKESGNFTSPDQYKLDVMARKVLRLPKKKVMYADEQIRELQSLMEHQKFDIPNLAKNK